VIALRVAKGVKQSLSRCGHPAPAKRMGGHSAGRRNQERKPNMKTKTAILLSLAASAALVMAGGTNSTTGGKPRYCKPSSFDKKFIEKAATRSLVEIYLGQLAQTNSQNAAVQQFGQRLVTDHTAIYQQAQELAQKYKVEICLDDDQKKLVRKFSRLRCDKFDEHFIADMIEDHIDDIHLFTKAALEARCAEVRAFARNNLPLLALHLSMALEIGEDIFGGDFEDIDD
jgi:putative membrane protein